MGSVEYLPENIRQAIKCGKCRYLDGYLRFLDEEKIDLLLELLQKTPLWEGGIPFATTAFADVLSWKDGFVFLCKLTEQETKIILSGTTFFFENIQDKEYQKDFFELDLYREAVEKYGEVAAEECFMIEPLPVLGGERKLPYLALGDLHTYLGMVMAMG